MSDWSRAERVVAQEIANASRAGRSISGLKIMAITGLSKSVVAAALRRLLSADIGLKIIQ